MHGSDFRIVNRRILPSCACFRSRDSLVFQQHSGHDVCVSDCVMASATFSPSLAMETSSCRPTSPGCPSRETHKKSQYAHRRIKKERGGGGDGARGGCNGGLPFFLCIWSAWYHNLMKREKSSTADYEQRVHCWLWAACALLTMSSLCVSFIGDTRWRCMLASKCWKCADISVCRLRGGGSANSNGIKGDTRQRCNFSRKCGDISMCRLQVVLPIVMALKGTPGGDAHWLQSVENVQVFPCAGFRWWFFQ